MLNRFNLEFLISPFFKILIFCYSTRNIITHEAEVRQTICFDLKYQLQTNLSFPNLREYQVFVLLVHEQNIVTESPASHDEWLVNGSSYSFNNFLILSMLKKLEGLGHNTWYSFAFAISKKCWQLQNNTSFNICTSSTNACICKSAIKS